jgi:hypothetical protein
VKSATGKRRVSKGFLFLVASIVLSTSFGFISPVPAIAVPVTADGDSAGSCTQNVSDSAGIVVTKVGNDCVVQFKNTGSITWTPSTNISVSYLVVAGGGSGTRGLCGIYWGQGGGGGEVLTGNSLSLTANVAVTVDVGAGAPRTGDCTETAGSNGSNSVLSSLTARGGKASLNSRTSSPTGAWGGISGNGNSGGNGGANGVNCTGGSCGAGGGGGAATTGSGFNAGAGIISDIVTTGTNVMYGSGGAGWNGTTTGTSQSGGATPGSSLCDAPGNQGGGGSDCNGHAATGGKGGSGLIVVRYAFDITAPTITSSANYSAQENQTSVGTATANESVTWSKVSGVDSASVTIVSATGVITFNLAPDFEALADVGGNNVYNLTIRATDLAGNATDQAIAITVTNVVDTSSFNSFALAGSATTATFRTQIIITADVTVSSKITFWVNGKVIPGCKNRTASGSASSFTVNCAWRPSMRGDLKISAQAIPISGSVTSSTPSPISVRVLNRTGKR